MDKVKAGGYCPKCDTVWCEPGVCNCVGIKSEGAIIAEAEMQDASDRLKNNIPSVFEIEVWNKAIEAAALEIGNKIKYPTEVCAIIRGLKK